MSIVHGRELKKPLREHCDVVIVGSGAGGMTMAAHLAEAGLDVIVLEEGAYYRSQDISAFKPSESLRRLFREAGMLAALGRGQTPTISLTVGRAVGGSSLLTGGVCFRIPSEVHHGWEHELGLTGLSERSLQDEVSAFCRLNAFKYVWRWTQDMTREKIIERGIMGNTNLENQPPLPCPVHPWRLRGTGLCQGLCQTRFVFYRHFLLYRWKAALGHRTVCSNDPPR